ncbi:MAG: SUMF1/EgtB/PvdO family nonheme iron enzyme [Spirochaeta sp.]|jgi:formylglycine-generating enzyme required for sulfatase activity|nr:SUMF1/EgtB/PvdO family nonheme iron enzyme [Spirochaeta sp.]
MTGFQSTKHTRWLRTTMLVVCCFLIVTTALSAQNVSEERTALLVANNTYRSFGNLDNPVPEARSLAAALRRIGFDVTVVENAGREAMLDALADFEQAIKSRGGGIAFFHYGGHAVQMDGKNYLIPSDAHIPDERRLVTRAVNSDEVMLALDASGSDTNIVILDACRNNPLPARSRSATRGLAPVTVRPRNSIIAYSAESDQEALDGVFTPVLTQAITREGVSFTAVLMEVRSEVFRRTNGQQVTGEYGQLFEPVYLAGLPGVASPAARPGFQVERTVGSIRVTVETAGTVYLDGERIGELGAGQSATLSDVETGSRRLEVRYDDGEGETSTVTVRSGTAATARFSYVERAEVRESIPTEFVQGGTFRMGSPSGGNDNERPVRSVTVSSFRMARTATTFAQYDEFARATSRDLPNDRGWGRGERPVINVTWYDAVAYANWLSEQDGLTPAYRISGTNVSWNQGANGWRLPTEAEWEFAARGGTQSRDYTYAGSDDVNAVAWYRENSNSRTQPVGGKRANEVGLYDMSGNVWEWMWDWFGDYPSSAQTDPSGPSSGSRRVLRGGSWGGTATDSRSADRYGGPPGFRNGNSGFRLVRPAVR